MQPWKTLVTEEVWQCEDFLEESNLEAVLHEMRKAEVKILDAGQARVVSSGYYNYNLHNWGLGHAPQYLPLRRTIFAHLNELFASRMANTFDGSLCNPMQLFSKSFNSSSQYEVHTEPEELFGAYAFIIYLQDEKEGALRFIAESDLESLFETPQHSRLAWAENVKFLRANGQSVRFIGDLKILPRRNLCVVFRTGSAHYVDPIQDQANELVRPCIAGWPFAFGFEKYLGLY